MNETGIESPPSAQLSLPPEERVVKSFHIKQQHLMLTQVILQDGTDGNQELVHIKEWLLHPSEKNKLLSGNLFIIEDMTDKSGRILLRSAPLPHARHRQLSGDLHFSPRKEGGFDFFLISDSDETLGEWIILDYTGGLRGRTGKLHSWQQSMRPKTPGHIQPRFLSNTWGDRSQDSRMNEDFIREELRAASKLGVEILQLDDGWQRGTTSNSVQAKEKGGIWDGFWNSDSHFWDTHPDRFPRGLAPLVKEAEERGIKIGLWFAPDSWNDFSQWERDAQKILELHRNYGIEHFKLDSIKAPTIESQNHLELLFKTVQKESGGRIVFDLDITAGIRPGYWGALSVGPLFVENRYTDWHNYWPHQTLRNLWSLSHWVDPRRLRMEFLNNARHKELYGNDPLAPEFYGADTLFAMVMFANPLGWFEVSRLSREFRETAAPLIKLWKQHREALFSGTLIPVGHKPDGWKPTGFLSLDSRGRSGYLLIFRELYEKPDFTMELPLPDDKFDWEIIYSSHESHIENQTHGVRVSIGKKLGFVWSRFIRS
jgi:alpha-galactosidase